jgi:hypothetical protein
MPICELDGCSISCQFGCSCVSAFGCECECEDQILPAFKWLQGMERADPEMIVNFTATEMPVIRLAEWFDLLFPAQIAIPAAKARAQITTDKAIRQIKLGDLIEQIGLVVLKKPLLGRALADYKPFASKSDKQ